MKTVQKLRFFIAFYLGILFFLLLSVVCIPVLIQHGLSVTQEFIIEEEIFETSLIVILFGIFFFILRGFKRILKAHELAVKRAGGEKSGLISRLTEAFSYIGSVNVELQEIQSILCGVTQYPQTQKELKRSIDHLATKAMTIAGTQWVAFRMIGRSGGRTIKEYTIVRPTGSLPSAIMGNREIIEDRHATGLKTIRSSQKNLDFLTACILPTIQLSNEQNILITAITNQIEMHYMLFRSGFLHQHFFNENTDRFS